MTPAELDDGLAEATPTAAQRGTAATTRPARDRGGVLWRWLVEGPDPVEADEPLSVAETLLPWPVRWMAVVALYVAASFWQGAGIGQQVAWGLQVGALALVAIIASLWWYILAADMILASLWLLPFQPPAGKRVRWRFMHVVTYVNRQLGHIALMVVWLLFALAASAQLSAQIGMAAAVLLLGPPVLNGIARQPWAFLGVAEPIKATGDLLWRRRVLIYVATVLGILMLALRAPSQIMRLLPLVGAFSGGMIIRIVRHELRNRKVSHELETDDAVMRNARKKFRRDQERAASGYDSAGPLLVVAALGLLVALSWWQRRELDADSRAGLDGPVLPIDGCSREPHGPVTADVALFLLADTQMHELAGERFPGQVELAEAFNKAAARPLALDMLSLAPMRRFAAVYAELQARRTNRSPMLWAHLGDMLDLACKGELARMTEALDLFARDKLAGIAMGNHEMGFEGSFHWSPYWDTTCASGRIEKDDVSQRLVGHFSRPVGDGEGEFVRLDASVLAPRGGSLSAVTPLGVVQHGLASRGVIGVFLDSNDGRAFDWGMPGSMGSVSDDQLDAASRAIEQLRARGGAYADPVYVLFMHFPYGDLHAASRARVARFVTRLDDRGPEGAGAPRVLSLLAAHTHSADAHRHCIGDADAGKRVVRELVVGSTTDPPEQAALVEIGPDAEGRIALSLRTLHAVARPGATCGGAPAIPAHECRAVAAQLLAAPACRRVLGSSPGAEPPRDCQELERPVSFGDELAALRTFDGPRDTKQKKRMQALEATQLLDCVCREGDCGERAHSPFDDESYAVNLRDAAAKPEREKELVCLAWAASARQAHKATGMTMGEALRCSFDDPTLPAERVSTATLETVPCY